jgi:hypothetical protein
VLREQEQSKKKIDEIRVSKEENKFFNVSFSLRARVEWSGRERERERRQHLRDVL